MNFEGLSIKPKLFKYMAAAVCISVDLGLKALRDDVHRFGMIERVDKN